MVFYNIENSQENKIIVKNIGIKIEAQYIIYF